ncbi:MAG: DUF3300 domain-containing protein [Candidatus Acidiferrum sp.]
MKRIQSCMSFSMAFLLLSGTTGMQGCGANQATSAPVAQQQPTNMPAQDASSPPASAAAAGQAGPTDQGQPQVQLPEVNLTADGLDELLGPVALYPDPVLAVLLQASVDPQEVMDGGNWLALDQNQNLKEAALDQASSQAGFTPVMQALLHYPTVVDLMCQQFDWTKQLGAAYQGNPKAVLASVQRLRAQAVDNGALKSSPQMTVDVKQDQGREVVELKPTDPKVVYVPQYDPSRVYSTTTTTTTPGGATTTTTTTSSPAAASSSSTVVVQQQKSGVSTESAVLIGLLSFGAGIAVGMAINNNNYYYPAWGYGGVWYGPRPYYPPPYRPVYYPGWHGGGYHYNRPVHYGNTNIYINNNNNYYNRFNNNNNLNPNYKPRPVPYNTNKNGVYAKSMGNTPGGNKGVNYRPANTVNTGKGQGNYQGNRPANSANANTRPATGNVQNRPAGANTGNTANTAQRPNTGNNANNWKGQTTYQGNKGGNATNTVQPRPSTVPGNANAGANNRANTGNANAGGNNRASTGNAPARNPSGDRGYGQPGATRPTTTNTPTARPSAGNTPAARPSTATQPAARPTPSQANRQPTSSNGGAFGGVSNPKSDRAASSRGQASMGAKSKPSGGASRKN